MEISFLVGGFLALFLALGRTIHCTSDVIRGLLTTVMGQNYTHSLH